MPYRRKLEEGYLEPGLTDSRLCGGQVLTHHFDAANLGMETLLENCFKVGSPRDI
jgi:hypothetical protein